MGEKKTMVETWLATPSTNYGVLLKATNETTDGCDVCLRSSEYTDVSYRPYLEVNYTRTIAKKYYLKDHLGNIRVTIDANGVVKAYDDYYPFGLQMPGRTYNNGLNNPIYKYSSKELDEENDLDWYYFGARYYDPGIGRLLTADPHASSYPNLTVYHYCTDNPMSVIDPTGKDTVELYQRSGGYKNYTKAEGNDVFFMVDENGNRITSQSITFSPGTLKGINRPTIPVDGQMRTLTLINMTGDENATMLFEFLADPKNTNVEWAHAKIGTEESGSNIVGTENDPSVIHVGGYLLNKNYTLRYESHNHPGGRNVPSPGDVESAKLFNLNTILTIYTHPGNYTEYNQFGPLLIQKIIITPNN